MDVLMPQLGETVAEGKITQWFKLAGDPIVSGDNLFEIETDKVSMEVPSTTTGVLTEIRVPAGAVAPVGAVVAVISDGTVLARGRGGGGDLGRYSAGSGARCSGRAPSPLPSATNRPRDGRLDCAEG